MTRDEFLKVRTGDRVNYRPPAVEPGAVVRAFPVPCRVTNHCNSESYRVLFLDGGGSVFVVRADEAEYLERPFKREKKAAGEIPDLFGAA